MNFRQWITEVQCCASGVGGIAGDVDLIQIGLAVVNTKATTYTVFGKIRLQIIEADIGQEVTARQADTHLLAGTEKVVLLNIGAKNQTAVLRETNTGREAAGALLFNHIAQVDHVVGAGHFGGVSFRFLEETQSFQTNTGHFNARL